MNVWSKEAVYPARYIYKSNLKLRIEIASGLLQGKECYKTESLVWIFILQITMISTPGSLSYNILSLDVKQQAISINYSFCGSARLPFCYFINAF